MDKLKSDKIKIEIEFPEKLSSLILENEILKNELIERRKITSSPKKYLLNIYAFFLVLNNFFVI